jgi:hypothetical protein
MNATTILNMQMGDMWKLMLVQMDDPRIERPYLVLRFAVGGQVPEQDQFEFKIEAIERFREAAFEMIDQAHGLGALSDAPIEAIRGQVEQAIAQTTQIMH